MILVDKKLIDPKTKAGQYIESRIAFYQQKELPIEFESYMEKQPKRFLVDGQGKPTAERERTQGVWIGSQERLNIPKVGPVMINWVRDLPDIKNGEYQVRRALIGVERGRLKVDPKTDPDKAFFLCEVSSVVRSGEVRIIDRARDDNEEVEKMVDNSFVEFMIGHKSSPIAPENIGSEELMRELAAGWGVSDSKNKALSTLRKELIINVKKSHVNREKTKRGYDEFQKDILDLQKGGESEVKLRKDIQMALEMKKLAHEDTAVIMFPDTDVQRILFKHRPTEVNLWVDKLINFFLSNPKILEELREEMDYEENPNSDKKVSDYNDLEITNKIEAVQKMKIWTQLLKEYQLLKLPEIEIPATEKMKFVKGKIIEYYESLRL
jgi:hypothetical protein